MKKTFPVVLVLILFASACTPANTSPPQTDSDTIGTMVALTTQPILTQSAQATQPPAPATQILPTLTDEEAITQALLARLGWEASELDYSIGENTGTVARGSLKKVSEMNGAAWFASKDSAGVWIIAYIGQGIPECVEIQAFNFPIDWISHCADASGNIVEIGQPAPPTQTDEEAITEALLATLGWNASELDFSIGENTSTVARGSLKKVGEMQGAAWFAGKDNNGAWVIAYIGQGIPTCSEIQSFNFPTDWISHCMDASGNTIQR